MLAPVQPIPVQGEGAPPILVLGGDADVFLPVSAFHEIATYFGADLKIIPGAPHCLMIDEKWWKKTADEILSWLAKSSA